MTCVHCQGIGLRQYTRKIKGSSKPCHCTLREFFRALRQQGVPGMRRKAQAPQPRHSFDHIRHARVTVFGAAKMRNYMADFYLLAKRNLNEEDFQNLPIPLPRGAD